MNRFVIISLVIISIVIIILGLFFYSYTKIDVDLNRASVEQIDWEPLSLEGLFSIGLNVLQGNWESVLEVIQGIKMNLVFGITNNGILPIHIPELIFDLYINEILVGNGISKIDSTINPGQTKEIVVLQNFEKDSLAPTIESLIDSKGTIVLQVRGTANFILGGLTIPIPFESSKQISIIDEINNNIPKTQ